MEENLKYFPKTAAALTELKQSTALLAEKADVSEAEKRQLSAKLADMKATLIQKAARIEEIITTLNGAIK